MNNEHENEQEVIKTNCKRCNLEMLRFADSPEREICGNCQLKENTYNASAGKDLRAILFKASGPVVISNESDHFRVYLPGENHTHVVDASLSMVLDKTLWKLEQITLKKAGGKK